jgi:hypothetical protein
MLGIPLWSIYSAKVITSHRYNFIYIQKLELSC